MLRVHWCCLENTVFNPFGSRKSRWISGKGGKKGVPRIMGAGCGQRRLWVLLWKLGLPRGPGAGYTV